MQVKLAEGDTGASLTDKVRAAMAPPKSASLELYLSSDGTPIEAGATLAAQGIGDGAALDVVVSSPKVGIVHRLTHACLPLLPSRLSNISAAYHSLPHGYH